MERTGGCSREDRARLVQVPGSAARELLGWCGLGFLDDTAEVEIKYLIKKSHWGKGLATEAARPCIAHAFRELALDRVIGLVHPDNKPSAHVLEKLGLVFANEARYFGIGVLRYTIDRERYEEFSLEGMKKEL